MSLLPQTEVSLPAVELYNLIGEAEAMGATGP